MGQGYSRCGVAVLLAVAAAIAGLLSEMLLFRRYGASPVPGPYQLDGTASGAPAGGGSIAWVWLGDSLSAGVGADSAEESFPWQTAAEVAVRVGRDVQVFCVAVPGATSLDVLAGQVPRAITVLSEGMTAIVAVGCNDVLRMVRPSQFRVTYEMIVRTLADTGADVVAVGVPDLGSMLAVMAQPLRSIVGLVGRRFDKAVRDVANDTGATYVAIHGMPSGGGRPRDRVALSADGWHPSGAGYRIWAEEVASYLVEALISDHQRSAQRLTEADPPG
jgi:lysophospholipase L1-like esterase